MLKLLISTNVLYSPYWPPFCYNIVLSISVPFCATYSTFLSGMFIVLIIGVNRPAFGGTVPHFHQMPRGPAKSADVPHFSKMVLFFFSLPIILHVCLATQQSDELRIKIGSKFARRQATDYKYTVSIRSVRQMPSILHARQPSPTTVYFFQRCHARQPRQHCYRSIHRSPTEKCSVRCLIWWVMVI